MARLPPSLCVSLLVLVTLSGCGLMGGVWAVTMEEIDNLVEGPLWNQTEIDLINKKLAGPIPWELGSLTNLTRLLLGVNQLSGPIPPELGSLTNLTFLSLGLNQLSGPIPPELGSLTNLTFLSLGSNNLSGPIPPPLFKFGPNTFFPGNYGLCCIKCSFSSPCAKVPPPAHSSPPPGSQPPPSPSPPLEMPSPPPGSQPPPPPPGSQPPPPPSPPLEMPSSPSAPVGTIVGGILSGAALFLALATLGFCLIYRRKRNSDSSPQPGLKDGEKDEPQDAVIPKRLSPQPSQGHFAYKRLQKATGHFAKDYVVGTGSFGTVYKGVLSDGSLVAIKRLETRPGRKDIEERSWKAEVEALGKVRHKNLVPLLGVCVERGERLLIFEYFSQGSLDRRLHHPNAGEVVLTWADRINIARSICQGLIYLHNHIRPPMVHRDIKAANILLTDVEHVDACIADFGLAHLVQDTGGKTSTMVKGTVPYMAPEYLHGGPRFLSPKCDVYSFGMLSLELISGRPVVRQLESGVVERLLKVATDMIREGRILELVDPALGDSYDAEEAQNYIHVAMACLRNDPSARPTMEGVGSQLARASVVDSTFREEDLWESEGSSAYMGSLSSSSGVRSSYQSTLQVASRFVTPR